MPATVERCALTIRIHDTINILRDDIDIFQSAFIPAVKGIIASKDDEAKRREARRKSLGKILP